MNTDVGLKGSKDVSRSVIGAAFRVANCLGVGFLEKVYENALAIELRLVGHEVEQQRAIDVRYRGEVVGHLPGGPARGWPPVVELKVAEALSRSSQGAVPQLPARDSACHTGLVINFGRPRLEIHRVLS